MFTYVIVSPWNGSNGADQVVRSDQVHEMKFGMQDEAFLRCTEILKELTRPVQVDDTLQRGSTQFGDFHLSIIGEHDQFFLFQFLQALVDQLHRGG